MATVKTILVPIDLEPHSAPVLDFARTLADALGATLHLLHVISYPMADVPAKAAHYADACARLKAMLPGTPSKAHDVVTSCVFGTPAPEIARYAKDHDVDLIVMGTHSHGPTFQMLTGSIAETVTGMVPCAVLTVKNHTLVPGFHTDVSGVVEVLSES